MGGEQPNYAHGDHVKTYDEHRIAQLLETGQKDSAIRSALSRESRARWILMGLMSFMLIFVFAYLYTVIGASLDRDGNQDLFRAAIRTRNFLKAHVTPDIAKDTVISLLALVAAINIALSVDVAAQLRRELLQVRRWRNQFKAILRSSAIVATCLGLTQWFGVTSPESGGRAFTTSILAALTAWLANITTDRTNASDITEAFNSAHERIQNIAEWKLIITSLGAPPEPADAVAANTFFKRLGLPLLASTTCMFTLVSLYAAYFFATGEPIGNTRETTILIATIAVVSFVASAMAEFLTNEQWTWTGLSPNIYRSLIWKPAILRFCALTALSAPVLVVAINDDASIVVRIMAVLTFCIPTICAPAITMTILWQQRVRATCPRITQPFWDSVWAGIRKSEAGWRAKYDDAYDRQSQIDQWTQIARPSAEVSTPQDHHQCLPLRIPSSIGKRGEPPYSRDRHREATTNVSTGAGI